MVIANYSNNHQKMFVDNNNHVLHHNNETDT